MTPGETLSEAIWPSTVALRVTNSRGKWSSTRTMQIDFEVAIEWNGRALTRWAIIDGRRIQLMVTREMICSIPMYNDALDWEIERHKSDIFERAKPQLMATLDLQ